MKNYERPFDLLNELKGRKIIVLLKQGKDIIGTFFCFDINVNLVLDTDEGFYYSTHIFTKEKKR